MKTALIVLVVLAGVVITGALVVGPGALSAFRSEPESTKVRVETVAKKKLIEAVKAPGTIEPHTKVEISSEVSARIEDLPFDIGAVVKKDEVVVKLDDRDLKASLDAAQARAKAVEASLQAEQARLPGLISTLNHSRATLERQQQLFASGDVAQSLLDDALNAVANADAQVEAAKFSISNMENSLQAANFDVDQTKRRLDKTVIRSPMDGVLIARNAEIGEVVLVGTMNNPGTVILKIANLSRMLVEAEVAETDVARLADSQRAEVHINAYRDQVFSGTVTQIAQERTENEDGTGYFEVKIEIDLQGLQIRTGGLANVDIEIASHDGLAVESQAIVDRLIDDLPEDIKRDNPLVDRSQRMCTVVYRLVDGKAVCTPVKRGPSDDTHSLVRYGLNEGDVVVIGPFKTLAEIKHGDALQIDSGGIENKTDPAESANGGGPGMRVRF